jgi:V8-like Glu-specific endopeptidase
MPFASHSRSRSLPALALILFGAAGCDGTNAAFYDFEDPRAAPAPIRAAAPAIVRIETATSYATGSFISGDGVLLTNNHVLGVEVCPREGCYARITLSYERGQKRIDSVAVFAVPQHVDIGLDMAIVQLYLVDAKGNKGDKFASPNSLTLDPRTAASLIGARVNVVGHPQGHLKKWTAGEVAEAGGTWFIATAEGLPGNSGSPILDEAGNIVGLLHRGPTSESLITAAGANLYSIATESAALVKAGGAPLPKTVVSIAAQLTDAQVVEREALYRSAHAPTANVRGNNRDVLPILGAACDAGLARNDYRSPEDFYEGVSACSSAMSWIVCTPLAPGRFGVCPAEDQKKAWKDRFTRLSAAQRALNGDIWLSAVSFAQKSLEATADLGVNEGRLTLEAALADARPPLDFSLALYLAAFNIESYDGKKLTELVRDYAAEPHYELSVRALVYTAEWLQRWKRLTADDVSALLSRLAEDPRVSLGDKLLIEEKRYAAGMIE